MNAREHRLDEIAAVERWRAKDRTHLRSYAGEQGPPFKGPAPERRADEPHTWAESWPFILCLGVIAFGCYVASAFGALP